MNATMTLIDLAGWVALLLWGLHMVQSGIQRAFGPGVRRILAMALGDRIRAFLAGLAVTAVLQSSTATALMAASFTAGGLVEMVPALAAVLGANVGTTLIVQVLSFDVSKAAPLLVLGGVVMFRRGTLTRTRDLGRVAIGLGLMLLALAQLLVVIAPFEHSPTVALLLRSAVAEPLIAIVFAAVLTWAAHSSVAVVLLVMSFVAQGVIPLHTGFALVLGANIGTAINPLVEAPAGDPAAKRLPLGNLLNRAVGCAIALIFFETMVPPLSRLEPDPARAIANFHTIFNLASAVLFLPLLTPWSRLLRRLLPTRIRPLDPRQPVYLDESARETPPIALASAAREALRMADVLETMLEGAREGIVRGDRRRIGETRRMDDVLDRLNAAITGYLSRLDPDELDAADNRRLAAILGFTTNLEHAGDVVEKNLMALAGKQLKRGLALPREAVAEVSATLERLAANLRTAAAVFMTGDVRAARRLAEEQVFFRSLESDAAEAHLGRVRGGGAEALETGTILLDVIRELRRINGHLVSAAYPILEERGELLPSRLRH
ncbi:MAG: Na/Pi cotransporter family protein [Rhodospirillales bacterium]|nr:Na/Pi cotransporter family protein [Rhodospirillales bacterium]